MFAVSDPQFVQGLEVGQVRASAWPSHDNGFLFRLESASLRDDLLSQYKSDLLASSISPLQSCQHLKGANLALRTCLDKSRHRAADTNCQALMIVTVRDSSHYGEINQNS